MRLPDFINLLRKKEQRLPVNQDLKQKLAMQLKISQEKTSIHSRWMQPAMALGSVCAVLVLSIIVQTHQEKGRIDDWQFNAEEAMVASGQQQTGIASPFQTGQQLASAVGTASGKGFVGALKNAMRPAAAPLDMRSRAEAEANIGLAVGGAKDIGNFRENIKQGYMPQASDLTPEGLFYEYYFETGQDKPCDQLFCPSYAKARSTNPLTGEDELYLSVGLNSNLKQSDLERPPTDFVIVLDISGSMGEGIGGGSIDGAYHDKLGLAVKAVQSILDQLGPQDKLGIVLFSDEATLAKPISLVSETSISRLKQHLEELRPTNGTNMSAGIEMAGLLLKEQPMGEAKRMIFLTDAMPNQGSLGRSDLQSLAKQNEAADIAMTFIGIGIDFQTDLVESLTKVRGANYLSLQSEQDFQDKLIDGFTNLVTPLVYDLRLDLEGSGVQIEKVYGSPDMDMAKGNILHIRTLFPSEKKEGQNRGGLVLLKLKKTGGDQAVKLHVQYTDTKKQQHESRAEATFTDIAQDTYQNLGIRKGIVLARYAELLGDWAAKGGKRGEGMNWQRSSQPIEMTSMERERFSSFSKYLEKEREAIKDPDLQKEQDILGLLLRYEPKPMERKPMDPAPIPLQDDWKYE